jgi:CheY-like chemotaxis protein
MAKDPHSFTIVIADDDPDDRMLIRDALEENRLAYDLQFVQDGEELMDLLYRRGKFAGDPGLSPPDLILLDLNMPRKNGREALQEIGQDPHLRPIPVVVLSTSTSEEDIRLSYELGANSFITKPTSFEGLVEITGTLGRYWLNTVSLPCDNGESHGA